MTSYYEKKMWLLKKKCKKVIFFLIEMTWWKWFKKKKTLCVWVSKRRAISMYNERCIEELKKKKTNLFAHTAINTAVKTRTVRLQRSRATKLITRTGTMYTNTLTSVILSCIHRAYRHQQRLHIIRHTSD